MAYPQVESISYGINPSVSGNYITITLPSGILKDDYIFGLLGTGDYIPSIYSSSGNFIKWTTFIGPLGNARLTCFSGRALGGGLDNLVFITYGLDIGNYIVYRISGHGMYSDLDISLNYELHYDDNVFVSPALTVFPGTERLFITAVAYTGICTSIGAPSGFTDVTHNPSAIQRDTIPPISLVSSTRESTASIIAGTWSNSPSDTHDYVTLTTFIKPGSLGGGTSELGIGIITQSGHISLA